MGNTNACGCFATEENKKDKKDKKGGKKGRSKKLSNETQNEDPKKRISIRASKRLLIVDEADAEEVKLCTCNIHINISGRQ